MASICLLFQTKHIILTHLVNYYNPFYFLLCFVSIVVVIWDSDVNTQNPILYTMWPHSNTSITLLLYNTALNMW